MDKNYQQLEKRIEELEKQVKSQAFLKWRTFDSVTDQYSPITGASQRIGFFGTSKIAKQTATGAKGGNAALTSVVSILSAYGLLTDSTS